MRRRLWPKAEVKVAAAATHFTHKYKPNGCIINSDVSPLTKANMRL
jgi:hypothetical protein